MNKKLTAIIACVAITVMSVVPAFASPESEVAAANAAQDARSASYLQYQQNLAAFKAAQVAQGQANTAAGQAAYAKYQEGLNKFYADQAALSAAQKAAGVAAYNAYQATFKATQDANLAQKAANEANRAELQKQINAYLAKL